LNRTVALFSESASRVVVSTTEHGVTEVLANAKTLGVPARVIGRTGGNLIRMSVGGQMAIDISVADAEGEWTTAIERHFVRRVA
jgi:phosphoribosylformylglycinamidine synthase subunit PurL